MVYYGNELYHHGILGQKWGIRRFQNKDGSYTEAGKKRRRDAIGDFYNKHKKTIANIGKTAAVVAAVGLSAYAIANNKEATARLLKQVGSKSVKALSSSAERVGNAMIDAMLISVGGIAINKLAEKLPTDDRVDETTRNKNKVIFDTASAGIKAATNANVSIGTNSNKGANVGKALTDQLGAPSNKGLDRQSSAYQNLFKDSSGNQRDADTRSIIKSLASSGYDIDQLQAYVRGIDNGTIRHSIEELGYCTVISLLNNYYI